MTTTLGRTLAYIENNPVHSGAVCRGGRLGLDVAAAGSEVRPAA